MSFQYELEITINAQEELPVMNPEGEWGLNDTWLYKDLYYGFKVKDTECHASKFADRVFTMTGTSTLEELQKQFMDLTKEVSASDTPPKYFKGGIELLNNILVKLNERDFDNNLEWEVSRHYPMFGVRLYLYKKPAPVKKDPESDGCVTGSLWRVTLKLKSIAAKSTSIQYDEDVYCIKPESAVHEAMDRMLRTYSGIQDKYVLETPIMVCKMTDMLRFPYIIIEEK